MATYWTRTIDNHLTDSVESISELHITQSTRIFYAQGEAIDYQEFFAISSYLYARHIVINSKDLSISLKQTPNRNGFEQPIVFENCTIKEIDLSDLKFTSLEFSSCKIDKLRIQQNCSFQSLKLQSGTILNHLYIGKSNYIEDLDIDHVKELNVTEIDNAQINILRIKNSDIGSLKYEQNSILSSFILDKVSFSQISLKQLELQQQFIISDCSKGKLILELCEIKVNDISINNSSLTIEFHKVRSYIKQIFRFVKSQKSKIFFERCYFSNEVFFQGLLYENGKNLFIIDTVFKDLVLFDDDHCKCLVVKECLFQNGLLLPVPKTVKIQEISSSAWCLLKNQAFSRNENIRAFEYRKNELISYTKELKISKVKMQERIVLFLNRISNNHGINWGRGLLFTLASWLLFYSLFALAENNFLYLTHLDCKFFLFERNFWSDALTYLWIPDGLNDLSDGLKMEHSILNFIFMMVFFILGKVSIAYGVFQTISAFRRHGKA